MTPIAATSSGAWAPSWPARGKTQEAEQQYQASLRIQLTPEAHLCFAELLERNGDLQGALTNCWAALALRPTPLDHVQAGKVLVRRGVSS